MNNIPILQNNVSFKKIFSHSNNNSSNNNILINNKMIELIMKLEDFVLDELVERVKQILNKILSKKKIQLVNGKNDENFKNKIREIQKTKYNFNINDYASYIFFTVKDIKKLNKDTLQILLKNKYILIFRLLNNPPLKNSERNLNLTYMSSSIFIEYFYDDDYQDFYTNCFFVILPHGNEIPSSDNNNSSVKVNSLKVNSSRPSRGAHVHVQPANETQIRIGWNRQDAAAAAAADPTTNLDGGSKKKLNKKSKKTSSKH